MNHRSGVAAFVLGILLAGAPAARAAPGEDTIVREAQDRALITQLMWRYARAIDTFDPDAYVAVFTPDGAFGATKGPAALRKMVTDLKKGRADREVKGEAQLPMHHAEMNQYIEFIDPDHARVHYYWMTLFGGSTPAQPPRVAAVGNGVDDVVRANGRWLIRYRNVLAQE